MENISYQPCSKDPPLLIRVPGEEKESSLGTRLTHYFQEYDIKTVPDPDIEIRAVGGGGGGVGHSDP